MDSSEDESQSSENKQQYNSGFNEQEEALQMNAMEGNGPV